MGEGLGEDLASRGGMEFNDFEHAPYIGQTSLYFPFH